MDIYKAKQTENGEWVEGYYYKMNETTYAFAEDYEKNPIPIHHYILFERMTDWGLPNQMYQVEVDPETVCRCTGREDISGQKIYQNDIIESHLPDGRILALNMVVKYGTYEAYCPEDAEYMDSVGFYVSAEGYSDMPLGPTEEYAKVIGNIFDNPELLEEDAE